MSMDNVDKNYKVGIVDDQALFRNGLSMLINSNPRLEVNLLAENGKDLLAQLEELTESELPDVILCDLEMPEMNGVETVKALNEKYPDIKVTILSGHYESSLILSMLEIGASAFVPKDEKPDEFYATIFNVIETGFHYNRHVVQLIREKMHFGVKSKRQSLVTLSPREREILVLICDQATNKEIAAKLFISVRTVEGHRNNLLNKTQAKNTAGLIVYAIEQGIYEVKIANKKWLI